MASRSFLLFHLNLVEIRQPSFETFRGTREEWIRRVLKDRFVFAHRRGTELVWVPKYEIGPAIFGVIQRRKEHLRHEAPEHGGGETVIEEWQGAYVLIDPTHHEDGQKMAVENDEVGRPIALAKSLFQYFNERPDRPYIAKAEIIFDASDFWTFAARHENLVQSITFKFVVPNMWGPQNDLEEDLKDTGKETGSDEVDVTFRGEDGVLTESDKVKQGVNYAERGAGKVVARALDGEPYSSDDRPKRTKIPKTDLESADAPSIIESMMRRILGRA